MRRRLKLPWQNAFRLRWHRAGRRSRAVILAAATVLGGIAGWAVWPRRLYRSSSVVYVGGQQHHVGSAVGRGRAVGGHLNDYDEIATQAMVACSTPVIRRAAKDKRLRSLLRTWSEPWARRRTGAATVYRRNEMLADLIACRPDPTHRGSFDIVVEHENPTIAAAIAKAIARAYVAHRRAERAAADDRTERVFQDVLKKRREALDQAKATLQAFDAKVSQDSKPLDESMAALRQQAMTLWHESAPLRSDPNTQLQQGPDHSSNSSVSRRIAETQRLSDSLGALVEQQRQLSRNVARARLVYQQIRNGWEAQRAIRAARPSSRVVAAATTPTRVISLSSLAALATLLLACLLGVWLLVSERLSFAGRSRQRLQALIRWAVPRRFRIVMRTVEDTMQIVRLRLRSSQHFLQVYEKALEHGGLYCATSARYAVGTRLVVDVYFPELPNPVLVKGTVVARRAMSARPSIRAGVLVGFDETEASKRDFLLTAAGSQQSPQVPRRRFKRLPVEIPVRWSTSGMAEPLPGVLHDISLGGVRLHALRSIDVGMGVHIQFSPRNGVRRPSLNGVVVHAHSPYYGIQFADSTLGSKSRRGLRDVIKRLVQA